MLPNCAINTFLKWLAYWPDMEMDVTSKFLLIPTLFCLAGCMTQPDTTYGYKDKPVTRAQKAADILECDLKAVKAVPANNQVAQTPVFRTPTYRTPVTCSSTGSVNGYGGYGTYNSSTNCMGGQVTGGQVYGGQAYSYDANSNLRDRVWLQCLKDKGYKQTTAPIPQCRKDQVPTGYVNDQTILHRPVPGACAITSMDNSGSVILLPKDQLEPN